MSDRPGRIRDHFDGLAPGYHEDAFAAAGMRRLSERDLAVVRDAARRAGGHGLALDVGVGTGRISAALAGCGLDVVGAEAAPGMIAEAAPRLVAAGFVPRIARADLVAGLPFASGAFDLVSCLRVLKYLDDAGVALAELTRVCRPGGVVLFDLANRRSVARFGYPDGLVTAVDRRTAEGWIAAAGLEVVRVAPGPHLPEPLWRAARAPWVATLVAGSERVASGVLRGVAARSWTFVARRSA